MKVLLVVASLVVAAPFVFMGGVFVYALINFATGRWGYEPADEWESQL